MDYRKIRKHYRAKYFAEIKALSFPKESNDKSQAKAVDITILNLSIDGAGVLTADPVEPGSIMTFNIYLGGIGHEVMAYATFCKEIGELYRVGLKFISPDNVFSSSLADYVEQERKADS